MAKKRLEQVHIVSYIDSKGNKEYEGWISKYGAKNRKQFLESKGYQKSNVISVPIKDNRVEV